MYNKKGYAWRLGEILIQQGWISWEQLEEALTFQKNPESMVGKVLMKKGFLSEEKGATLFLGEILIRNGWIQWDQLSEALGLQQTNNRILGEILMERGYLTKRNLFEALAIQNKIPFINLKEIRVPNEVIHMIPKSLVHEFRFLPLMKRDGIFLIAIFAVFLTSL